MRNRSSGTNINLVILVRNCFASNTAKTCQSSYGRTKNPKWLATSAALAAFVGLDGVEQLLAQLVSIFIWIGLDMAFDVFLEQDGNEASFHFDSFLNDFPRSVQSR